jgi:hypothetical protein
MSTYFSAANLDRLKDYYHRVQDAYYNRQEEANAGQPAR